MQLTYRHTKLAAYIGYITQAIVNNLTPLLFVSFQRDFGLGLDRISLLITMNFGIQIVTDLLAAKYVDKIGYRAAMLIAHGAVVLGLGSLSFLPFVMDPFAGLCLCSALNAVGGGLTEVVVSPIVEALPGDEKASAMSILHSFYCWGQVAVVALSTLFFRLAGVENWRVLPLFWLLVPLFNLFLCARVPMRTLNEEGGSLPLKKLFGIKVFWLFLVLMVCAGASELAMSQWASLFAEQGLQVSKTFGDLLGPCAFAVLMGAARAFFGVKGERIDLRRFLLGSGVLCVFSYLTAVFAPHPVLSLAGCALCGLSVGLLWPGTFSLAAKRCPQGGTAMFAVLALAGDIGCSTGPALCGFLAEGTGELRLGLLGASLFPLILVVCMLLLKQGKRQESGE